MSRHTSSRNSRKSGKKQNELALRDLAQQNLLNVFQTTHEQCNGWIVLVIDGEATRVMSSAVGMYDLMEQHISIVENLALKRAPFRDMDVIYLISQTEESVNQMIADWTRTDPLYGNKVFVYFLGSIPDNVLAKIKQCKPLLKRIKALGELNLDFLAKEKRAFHLDLRSDFRQLYVRDGPTVPELVIVEKLVTVCATLNEYPHIRYSATSPRGSSLANLFHLKMNEFVSANEKWWYHGDSRHTDKDRSTLLLLDRADDCLSPLMHEFTYQAMVYDLLPIDDERITCESEKMDGGAGTVNKDILLNEKDDVWVELRGKHIAEVVQILSQRIRDIMNSSTNMSTKRGDSGETLSVSQMADMLKKLPEYQEVMSKISQHMHISHQCLDIFTKEQLFDLAELEQTLATGQTEEGRKPKMSDMVNEVENKLKQLRDANEKIRLLAIMTISQKGLREADRDRLLRAARLSRQEEQILDNLEVMGLPLYATSNNKRITSFFGLDKLSSSASGSVDDESEFQGSRYQVGLKSILDDINDSKLSIQDYPSVLPLPETGGSTGIAVSARTRAPVGSARARSSDRRGGSRFKRSEPVEKKQTVFSGGRQIIFMVGGMCYSELRVIREAMRKGGKEFVAGSTHFIKPSEFVEDLGTLSGGSSAAF